MASYYHEVLEVVARPHLVIRGNHGTLKAVRSIGKQKWMVVVYRELSQQDGFVITAYTVDSVPTGKIAWRTK